MITKEAELQFSNILEELGKALDPTETQIKDAKSRYKAIGNYLSEEDSPLAPYKPEIKPQGSFLIGTMIKPVSEECELDFDLTFHLTGKPKDWTQYDLKKAVGDRLFASTTYKGMLEKPDGRRCWRIDYAGTTKFHLDILPSVIDNNLLYFEKSGTITERNVYQHALRITDNMSDNYFTETNHKLWPKSNPKGFGEWFKDQMKVRFVEMKKSFSKTAGIEIENIQDFEIKTPLQRAVQILKRHRDIMFGNDEDRPISIIITTLAGLSYNQEDNIYDALINILEIMPTHIKTIFDSTKGEYISWIANPVNPEENFADKWIDTPRKKTNFIIWLKKAKEDILQAIELRGLNNVQEKLEKSFGNFAVKDAFQKIAENQRFQREKGNLHIAPKSGIIGSIGTPITNHNFYGKKEQ